VIKLVDALIRSFWGVRPERGELPKARGTEGLADIRRFHEQLRAGKRTEPGRCGCLTALAMTEVGHDDLEAVPFTQEYRRLLTDAFRAAVSRAEATGDLAPGSADAPPPRLTGSSLECCDIRLLRKLLIPEFSAHRFRQLGRSCRRRSPYSAET
jgi:hypothetical protein